MCARRRDYRLCVYVAPRDFNPYRSGVWPKRREGRPAKSVGSFEIFMLLDKNSNTILMYILKAKKNSYNVNI